MLAGRQTMPEGWSLSERTLPYHDIIWVEAGRGVFTSGKQRREVMAPAWVVLPSQLPHAITGEGLTLGVVHIEISTGENLDALKLFFPELEITPSFPDGIETSFRQAIDAWKEDTPVGRVCANRWMELWFARAFGGRRPSASVDARLVDALVWLHQHAHHPSRLDEMSRDVGLSAAHLRSLFRRHFGASPKKTLQEIRLKRACELLEGGRVSIAEAGYQAGWEDASAFAKSFKRRFGLSPGEYRRLREANALA
jgi:AraC-like DNA-binding protein